MATLIQEPTDVNPDTPDWQALLYKLSVTTGGLLIVDFTEKQSLLVPKIITGSKFELNNSFYTVGPQNEDIQNWNSISNGKCYCYAKSNTPGIVDFTWNNTAPTFQVVRGGWYHPSENWRCILSAYKNGNDCLGKAIMGFQIPYGVPTDKTGVQIVGNSTLQSSSTNIESGWYKVVLIGGKGGSGAPGGTSGYSMARLNATTQGTSPTISGFPGIDGSVSDTKELYLWLEKGTIELRPGRTGNNGVAGNNGANPGNNAWGTKGGDGGAGGDGANGEESVLLNNGKIVAIQSGGNAGPGGNGGTAPSAFYIYSEQIDDNVYNNYLIITKAANGANGQNGVGYQSTISGSVAVYIL